MMSKVIKFTLINIVFDLETLNFTQCPLYQNKETNKQTNK